ncbi:MAG: DUF2878 domain-containing protein, partial [Acidobacteriota bacterium]
GAAYGMPWLGPPVVLALVIAHLVTVARTADAPVTWRAELGLIVALGVYGTAADSLQSGLGLLAFVDAAFVWLCPLWITALWLHFGTVLRSVFGGFADRPFIAFLMGAVGGPLAYAAGARLGALAFPSGVVPGMVSIAVVWGITFPLWLRLAQRQARSSSS